MTPPFLLSNISSVIPLLCPIVIWFMCLCFVVAILFALKDGVKRLRRLHQIPCDRCLYNTGSPYLRCPIHPLAAFSEEAICCRDFEPASTGLQPQLVKRRKQKHPS
jgi:hypothetical protein